MGTRVRFAPSPSGYLHIGGARTALFNWLWARHQGGQMVLRIEDTDRERSSLDSVRAILDALDWLGLDWDEGPERGGASGPYYQSERKDLYRQAADRLIASGKAYRCYCTKEDLARARAALRARDPKAQFVYPGTCRSREDAPDIPHVVRFRSPVDGQTAFVDTVFGDVTTPNSALQDFVILRTDGLPLYNLACVVDDHEMGITLVARGRDHIGNTPQQVLLYEAFGWEPPRFAHLPMMLSPRGEKLSKRHGAVSVEEYRNRGFTPGGVLNYLARFGWSFGDQEIFSTDELIRSFDWKRVGKADGKFDERKFGDVAFEHLKNEALTTTADYAARVRPFLAARGLEVPPEGTLARAIQTIRPRARNLVEAANAMDYYFRDPPVFDEKAKRKFLTVKSTGMLAELARALEEVSPWEAGNLEATFQRWIAQRGRSMKEVAQPARVALTGRAASPGLYEVMVVLGRDRCLRRLSSAASIVG